MTRSSASIRVVANRGDSTAARAARGEFGSGSTNLRRRRADLSRHFAVVLAALDRMAVADAIDARTVVEWRHRRRLQRRLSAASST